MIGGDSTTLSQRVLTARCNDAPTRRTKIREELVIEGAAKYRPPRFSPVLFRWHSLYPWL